MTFTAPRLQIKRPPTTPRKVAKSVCMEVQTPTQEKWEVYDASTFEAYTKFLHRQMDGASLKYALVEARFVLQASSKPNREDFFDCMHTDAVLSAHVEDLLRLRCNLRRSAEAPF